MRPVFLRRVEFMPTRMECEGDIPPDASRTFSPAPAPGRETPEERFRFWTRFAFCVALIGFGTIVLAHAGGI